MKTLIVGGGLSGLALANSLEHQGDDYLLLEARSRFGGRISTQYLDAGYFDVGPAWFWAGQSRIADLVNQLKLEKFEQFSAGALTFEDEHGLVQHGKGFSSMEGSWRLVGGFAALTDALANQLSDQRIRLNSQVIELAMSNNQCIATLRDGERVAADRVVLALPPRVASAIKFSPALPEDAMRAMQNIPTWMAGQAKAVAVYDAPFWRDRGLSGDAISRKGPMIEIHDASPFAGGPFALFGFIGIPANGRADEQALRQQLLSQLSRLFGPQAAEPRQLYLKDWAFDPYTATKADQAPLYSHPTYDLPKALTNLWDGKLKWSGTEVAPEFGGYVEGALEAAENAFATLKQNG